MKSLRSSIEGILEAYANYVYYEGDPMRGGTSKSLTIDQILTLFEKSMEELVDIEKVRDE